MGPEYRVKLCWLQAAAIFPAADRAAGRAESSRSQRLWEDWLLFFQKRQWLDASLHPRDKGCCALFLTDVAAESQS